MLRSSSVHLICFFVIIYICQSFAQKRATTSSSIVNAFTSMTEPKPLTTPTAPRPSSTNGPATRSKPGCRCVPQGTCAPLIDTRITNEGTYPNCAFGDTWCCASPESRTNACGVRIITNAPSQPPGTAMYGEYPWHVAILEIDNTYVGSAVLISANYAITTAHRISAYSSKKLKVRLGDWDRENTTESYPAREYKLSQSIVHPDFNANNLQNDIAILKINETVPLAISPHINPACVPKDGPVAGQRCWVTGWGKNVYGRFEKMQRVLKDVDVPIVDQDICEQQLRATRLGVYFQLDKASFICAGGEGGKDACEGDGGAPLVCESKTGQWQVMGLVAWGIGCGIHGVPGVYVNVHNYMPWINQHMIES